MTMSLDNLLGSVSLAEFFEDVYEQKPLVIKDHPADRFHGLAQLKDFDYLLGVARHSGRIRLAKGMERPPLPITREGWLAIPALHDAFQDGCSIIMDGLLGLWPPLQSLVDQLEEAFRQRDLPILAPYVPVLFLTPPDAQALPPHYDTNDLFIFQLDGRKRWLLYDFAKELPLMRHKLAGDSVIERDQLGPPSLDLVLEPGHVLYLPRGYVHEALTDQTHSFHLTLGVNEPASWHHAISALAEELGSLRHSLPPGVLQGDKLTKAGKAHLRDKLQELLDNTDLDVVMDKVRIAAPGFGRGPRLRGFQGLADSRQLNAATRLRVRPGLSPSVHYLGTEMKLVFGDDFLTGPLALVAAFEFLETAEGTVFLPTELPGLGGLEAQLTLASRLVRQGFLECLR